MKANASCSGSGWSDGAAARRTFQFSESGTWPAVATKSKYASTVPANASAMPTEQMRMYFHDASTDALVRRSGMTSADMIVVASMATHMSATFWTVTAASIVKANAFVKIRNCRFCGGSSSSVRARPGPMADANSATNVMQSASSAERASTRHTSATCPSEGPCVTTSTDNKQLPAKEIAAQATLTHPTGRVYGRMTIARSDASSGGTR